MINNNLGQLQTLEGFAAAMLMVATVYFAIQAVTMVVPQTELHLDAQLKQYGQDALMILDTEAPPTNASIEHYSSTLKTNVLDWINDVSGLTSFFRDEFKIRNIFGDNYKVKTFTFNYTGVENNTFNVTIPENVTISHAYVDITGSSMLVRYANLSNPNTSIHNFGYSVASGDVDGNGIADIIVGAYGNDSTTGAVYIYNKTNKTTTDKLYNITFSNPNGSWTDYFGYSVASGDVNNDGIADIIVGAYKTDSDGNNDTGKVYVYYGNNTSIPSNPDVTILDPHNNTNDYFGYSLASGDVNNDGFADIIASAIGVDNGTVYIYYGTEDTKLNKTLNSPNITLVANDSSDSFFGISISSGDVNKDGFTDVIVGANKSNEVYIFFGPITSNRSIANVTLEGTSGDNFGISTSVGDINNDGANDVLVGADKNNSAHIYYGGTSLSGTISNANLTILGSESFGHSVSYAGDIDSDGYGDVVVGAPYENSKKGKAYVYRGGLQTGIITNADYILSDPENKADDYFGISVSGANDVDNDGYPDVIIGANGVNNSEGAVYVYTPRFPEYPWLGVGNTTGWTTVWHYYSVIKDDNGIGNGSSIPYNAGQTFNKTLSIYRNIKTDIILSMNVSSEADAKVIVSVNGIGVNDTSPPINTSGNPMWWNITLPGDISEWTIGNNTVAIEVRTGTVNVYLDENSKDMIRLYLPIDQPLDSTETTPDFADALNEYMATHNESEDGTADNNYTIPFILHSNSTGKLKLSNLRIRSTPQLDENLDKLLPDHVNYNVIFAYLDTLRRYHLYNFSSGTWNEILEYDSAGNKTINITLPNESIVYSAKMDISGLPLYKGFEINSVGEGGNQMAQPSLKVDSNGIVHIAWVFHNTSSKVINYLNSMDWNTKMDVGESSMNGYPSLAVDSNGVAYLAWVKSNAIYYSIYNGTEWSTPSQVNVSDSNQDIPSLDVDTNGVAYLAWEESNAIYYSIYNGTGWSPALQVNDSIKNQGNPSLDVDEEGNVHVAWVENKKIYYSIYNGTGWLLALQVNESSHTQDNPSLAVDNAGNVYVAWEESGVPNGTPSIYFAKYNGTNWTNAIAVNDDNDGTLPSLDVDSYGNVYIVWEDKKYHYVFYTSGTGEGKGNAFYVHKPYIDVGDNGIHEWNYFINKTTDDGEPEGNVSLGNGSALYKTFTINEEISGDVELSMYVKGNQSRIEIYVNNQLVRSPYIPNMTTEDWWNITIPSTSAWKKGDNEIRIECTGEKNNTYYYDDSITDDESYYYNGTQYINIEGTWMIRLYAEEYRGTQTTSDFSNSINDYLTTHNDSDDGIIDGNIIVPILVHSDSAGKITLSNLRVYYYIRGEPSVMQQRVITNGIAPENSVTSTQLVTLHDWEITDMNLAKIPEASIPPDLDIYNVIEVRLELWYI